MARGEAKDRLTKDEGKSLSRHADTGSGLFAVGVHVG